ncbi:unnamed protein product, partial [Mesorhabditis spiculigera]
MTEVGLTFNDYAVPAKDLPKPPAEVKLPPSKPGAAGRSVPSTNDGSQPANNNSALGNTDSKNQDSSLTFPSESLSASGRQSTLILTSTHSDPISTDEDFYENYRAAQEAIRKGHHPILIPEGTSGSYFVQDTTGRYLAVFKPKDEEPFAPLNPKWPKFFQRMLCFCCFGRACLIPNNAYLSEAAASLVDERLNLHVVPKTRVVKLASSSFFYKRTFGFGTGSVEHWPKEGSYQLFMHGYEPASTVLARWDYDPNLLSEGEEKEFKRQFQRLCVLDYVIRNTDRHRENWLIKHIPGKEIRIAAIDNGLAFPVKHPECASRFRRFPFQWATLKWANESWDVELRKDLMQRITPFFIHNLCSELRPLLRHDHLDRSLTSHQLKVVRGQLYNLSAALEEGLTPAEMSRLVPVLLHRKYRKIPSGGSLLDNFTLRDMDYNGRVCC